MSRNLCSQVCVHCEHPVVLCEKVRPITKGDAGHYFDEFEGVLVANALCPMCDAKYLAWMDTSAHDRKYGCRERRSVDGIPVDLSYRSTFNDEPGDADLPAYVVEKSTVWVRKGRYK